MDGELAEAGIAVHTIVIDYAIRLAAVASIDGSLERRRAAGPVRPLAYGNRTVKGNALGGLQRYARLGEELLPDNCGTGNCQGEAIIANISANGIAPLLRIAMLAMDGELAEAGTGIDAIVVNQAVRPAAVAPIDGRLERCWAA